MSSTLVGRSGRVYVRDKVLQVHPKKSELDVYLAHCENRPFVLKPVSPSIFELSKELKHEFEENYRVRTHIDYNEEERILIYEYFMDNLLSLVKNNPELPIEARKSVLRELGLGLKDIHAKNWLHLDIKPNNVMLNWSLDKNSRFTIERVALSDLDCALKLKGEKLLDHRMGNVMWRSPEGQMGKGIGKPSEVFSFGLVCLYTVTGVEALHPDFEQLQKEAAEPEQVILYKLLSIFGPLPPELITHVNDEYWGELLTALSQVVADEDSSVRFEQWGENVFPNLDRETKRVISRMTSLDPKGRATMDEILEDPWWKRDEDCDDN
ncbi:hypothetical protein LTS08_008822 [Lithohypha guttulata]|nr:hypothetical protein LTS08_008822 [Lithohypha guttulata]